ncbi:tetraspanin family protein [Medicago truncatula]|uniref:Tetraspanin family protein n=1 Tax=Medicago truncatula TaxID=3880 RepID=G7JVR3_MEDTR|nr:tetraspanin family protein [Medicago truncatula]
MAKRPFFEFILKVINLVFFVWGLGTLGYGLACFFKWKQTLPNGSHRLLLAQQSQETLPKALFIYVMIGIGAILLIISCVGYIGTALRSPCCLLTYCVFLVPLIIVELGIALFIFFDHRKQVIPKDVNEDIIYNFFNDHWKIFRWIALGEFILQIIALILAIYLRSVFSCACYDSDDERVQDFLRSRKQSYNRLGAATHAATRSRSSIRLGVHANARDSTQPASPSNTAVNVNARDSTNLASSSTTVVNVNARDATKPASSSNTAANVNVKDATTSTNNVV